MNKIIAKAGLLVMTGLFLIMGIVSCKKEAPTVAIVDVIDTSGAPVPGAMVRLYPSPTIDEHGAIVVDDTMRTNAAGRATFDFSDHFNLGQAGVFILDIEVNSGDSIFGTGILKVVEEKTTSESVLAQ